HSAHQRRGDDELNPDAVERSALEAEHERRDDEPAELCDDADGQDEPEVAEAAHDGAAALGRLIRAHTRDRANIARASWLGIVRSLDQVRDAGGEVELDPATSRPFDELRGRRDGLLDCGHDAELPRALLRS